MGRCGEEAYARIPSYQLEDLSFRLLKINALYLYNEKIYLVLLLRNGETYVSFSVVDLMFTRLWATSKCIHLTYCMSLYIWQREKETIQSIKKERRKERTQTKMMPSDLMIMSLLTNPCRSEVMSSLAQPVRIIEKKYWKYRENLSFWGTCYFG